MVESAIADACNSFYDGDVVNAQQPLLITVEVADGNIAHAAESTQVGGIFEPYSSPYGTCVACPLSMKSPFHLSREVVGIGVASYRNCHTKMFVSIIIFRVGSPEGDASA